MTSETSPILSNTPYRKEFLDFGEIGQAAGYGGIIYLASYETGRVREVYPSETLIYEESGPWYIYSIAADEGGLWLLEQPYFELDVSGYRVIKLSYAGNVIGEYQMSGDYELITTDSAGNVYVAGSQSKDKITVVSTLGETSEISVGAPVYNLWRNGDGTAAAWTMELKPQREAEHSVVLIEDGMVKDTITSPKWNADDGSGLITGGLFDYVALLCDSTGIYGVAPKGDRENILIWAESGLPDVTVQSVCAVNENTYFCFGNDTYFLVRQDSETAAKKRLTLATFIDINSTNYGICVKEFNDINDDYYIKTVNYCADRDLNDALLLLNTQLITGNGPDIICFDGRFSSDSYAAKGYLLDLYELIDRDDTINRDDILLSGLMEKNGGLYALASDFYISTWYTAEAALRGKNGWTYDDYASVQKSLGGDAVMLRTSSAENVLDEFLAGYIGGALDWSAGECDFDNPTFANILSISKEAERAAGKVASEEQWRDLYREGKIVLNYADVISPKEFARIEEEYSANVNFIGLPTADGSNGSAACFFERFGISSQSECADGAWEFIRSVLLSERAAETYFWAPVYRPALRASVELLLDPTLAYRGAAITRDEDGNYYIDGVLYGETDPMEEKPIITQRQAERFYDLLDGVKLVSTGEPTIRGIVMDEAARFFAGEKTAEECARLIQSRVNLYMGEQAG